MELAIKSPKYGEIKYLIDDEDYEKIKGYSWYLCYQACVKGFYIHTPTYKDSKRTTMLLHRLIMDFPNGMQVDHINHNTLDNRKCNLRICTRQENQMNRKPNKNSLSLYKGVSKGNKKWVSRIRINKNLIHLGRFNNEIDAALVYNGAAKYLYGEYANLNDVSL